MSESKLAYSDNIADEKKGVPDKVSNFLGREKRLRKEEFKVVVIAQKDAPPKTMCFNVFNLLRWKVFYCVKISKTLSVH